MSIRRCVHCNSKTQSHKWDESKCPVCYSGLGWVESKHGSLNDVEIESARRRLSDSKESDIREIPTKYGRER